MLFGQSEGHRPIRHTIFMLGRLLYADLHPPIGLLWLKSMALGWINWIPEQQDASTGVQWKTRQRFTQFHIKTLASQYLYRVSIHFSAVTKGNLKEAILKISPLQLLPTVWNIFLQRLQFLKAAVNQAGHNWVIFDVPFHITQGSIQLQIWKCK